MFPPGYWNEILRRVLRLIRAKKKFYDQYTASKVENKRQLRLRVSLAIECSENITNSQASIRIINRAKSIIVVVTNIVFSEALSYILWTFFVSLKANFNRTFRFQFFVVLWTSVEVELCARNKTVCRSKSAPVAKRIQGTRMGIHRKTSVVSRRRNWKEKNKRINELKT